MVTDDAGSVTLHCDWNAGWWVHAGGRIVEAIPSAEEALACAVGRRLDRDEGLLAATLDAIYESEINVRLQRSTNGWAAKVGGDGDPCLREERSGLSLSALLDWLPSAVCRTYPGSDYARRYVPAAAEEGP